jgi:hypothetical protein
LKIDFENGTITELDPLTIEFNDFLRTVGIDALYTKYHDTNYLSIWVFSIDDVRQARQIAKTNYGDIISFYKRLLTKHRHSADFDKYEWKDFSVSSINSFEIDCIGALVRRCKEKIIDKINLELKNKPEYIFCHSDEEKLYSIAPGYRFVYRDAKALQQSAVIDQIKIHAICDTILKEGDKAGFYSFDKIQVSFFDKLTSASSLYGMTRED